MTESKTGSDRAAASPRRASRIKKAAIATLVALAAGAGVVAWADGRAGGWGGHGMGGPAMMGGGYGMMGDGSRMSDRMLAGLNATDPCRIWHQRGRDIEEIAFDVCDQYTIQGDLFAASILNDTPVPTPLTDAVANMRLIEAIIASARQDAWVTL